MKTYSNPFISSNRHQLYWKRYRLQMMIRSPTLLPYSCLQNGQIVENNLKWEHHDVLANRIFYIENNRRRQWINNEPDHDWCEIYVLRTAGWHNSTRCVWTWKVKGRVVERVHSFKATPSIGAAMMSIVGRMDVIFTKISAHWAIRCRSMLRKKGS